MATGGAPKGGGTISKDWGGSSYELAQAIADTAASGDEAARAAAEQRRAIAAGHSENILAGSQTALDAATQQWQDSKAAPGLHREMAALHRGQAQNFRDVARAAAARTTGDLARYMVGAGAGRNPYAARDAAVTSGRERARTMLEGEQAAGGALEKAQQSLINAYDAEMETLKLQVAMGEKSSAHASLEAQMLAEATQARATDLSTLNAFLQNHDIWFVENSIRVGDSDQEGAPWSSIYMGLEAALPMMTTQWSTNYVLALMRYASIMSQGQYSTEDAAYLAGFGQGSESFTPNYGTKWGGLDPHNYEGAPVGPTTGWEKVETTNEDGTTSYSWVPAGTGGQ